MSVHLISPNTTERVRSSDGCTVLPCGCAHTDTRWLQLCEAHFDDWHDRRAQAMARRNTEAES